MFKVKQFDHRQKDSSTSAPPASGGGGTAEHAPQPVMARHDWVDLAKATAIVLVVHYHVVRFYPVVAPDLGGWWWRLWRDIAAGLVPVRMPAFFLMSGILAANALRRPWRDLIRPRYAALLWPYVIWSVAFTIVYAPIGTDDLPAAWWNRLPVILMGGDAYWFLSVLVVLFTTARVLRNYPSWLLLTSFCAWMFSHFASGLLDGWVPDELATNVGRLATFAMWYFIGCFAKDWLLEIAKKPAWALLMPSLLLFLAIWWAFDRFDQASALIATRALNVTGVAAFIAACVLLARIERVRRLGLYLARRTLPIYVVHALVVYGARLLVDRTGWAPLGSSEPPGVATMLLIPLATVGLVLLATQLADRVRGTWLDWLFTPPLLGRRGVSDVASGSR